MNATCERCGGAFERRTNERRCTDCTTPLRRLRQEAGLTLIDLARAASCPRPVTLSELERDANHHPKLALATAIASALGTDVAAVFPRLEITKGEAQRILAMTSRTLKELCETGELSCNGDGHWHRIPYADVIRLAGDREELRSNWVSFNAWEHEHPEMPRWVLDRLHAEGKLVVRIGDNRGTKLARRTQLEKLRVKLEAQPAECPHCGRPVQEIGRLAHRKCLGPLGVKHFWTHPEHAADRERHGPRIRGALARLKEESPRRYAEWYSRRFKSNKMFGKLAKLISQTEGAKKSGRRYQLAPIERAEIRDRYFKKRESQRTIAAEMGVTRHNVRSALHEQVAPVSTAPAQVPVSVRVVQR